MSATIIFNSLVFSVLRDLFQPPPESLESLVQMARRATNVALQTQNNTEQPATTEPSAPPDDSATATSEAGSQRTVGGVNPAAASAAQNSQARGNTQTNPTTATHTRSTSRPHVHLAQHAMHTTVSTLSSLYGYWYVGLCYGGANYLENFLCKNITLKFIITAYVC